jgi:transcriptional regulator with XRE-family HTH domain
MRDEHREGVGAAIAHLRERQGWSQRQLATWVGLDQSAVSRIEAGRRRVSAEELQRFAGAFHVSADDLLASGWDTASLSLDDRALEPRSAEGRDRPPSATLDEGDLCSMVPDGRAAYPSRASFDEPESDALQSCLEPEPSGDRATPGEPRESRHDESRELLDDESREWLDDVDEESALPPTPAPASPARFGPAEAPAAKRRLSWSKESRQVRAPFLPSDEPSAARSPDDRPSASRAPHGRPLRHADASRLPSPARPRVGRPPAEITAVVRDWFALRRLAGVRESPPAWSTGHSAEGKTARLTHPIQPTQRGPVGGEVLYDRVARFWRSELHLDPDDGPVPDLVPLLEDGLGIQVIVARVAGGSVWDDRARRPAGGQPPSSRGSASSERPVSAVLTFEGVPFIFVNAARPVVLQRFALAHAFAHLVLGHGDVVDAQVIWSRNNPHEAAANDFAEELLLPVRAARRWWERRGDPRPDIETLLELGNAFGISAWSAFYRSRAAGRLSGKQLVQLRQELQKMEWELLPRQAFLGGLRDTLSHLTPGECLPPGHYGEPAVLRVPAAMRRWAVTALRDGSLGPEHAAACLRVEPGRLEADLTAFGLHPAP